MIRLVVFDMAGTTVDDAFSVHDAMIRAFDQYGLTIDRETASQAIAVPKPVGIHRILTLLGQESPYLETLLLTAFKSHMRNYYANDPGVQEVPGASALFSKLKEQNIQIGLDTGFDRELADVILQRLRWIDHGFIDASVASDEVRHGRPHPAMIFALMEQAGIQRPDQVVKVGDTPTDIEQGRRAQCRLTIGRYSGAFPEQALINAGADAVVTDILDILPILHEAKAGSR